MAADSILLTYTDRCLVHIARALIMNPEVLVIHKPLSHFDEQQSAFVLCLLREFVDMRGVDQVPEERRLRRPRTCIISLSTSHHVDEPDTVLRVEDGKVTTVTPPSCSLLQEHTTRLFSSMDIGKTGTVGRHDFIETLLKKPAGFTILGLEAQDLEGPSDEVRDNLNILFNRIDVGGNGDLEYEELLQYARNSTSAIRRMSMDLLKVPSYRSGSKDSWTMPAVPFEENAVQLPREE